MNNYKSFLFSSAISIATLFAFQAEAIETKAKNAILMDFETGTVFYKKNADEKMPPASMSKLLTTYVILDQIENGILNLDDVFVVSENAWRKGGVKTGSSTMFLNVNDRVKLKDILRGIIVQSGNDACIAAAENIAGSEAEFVEIANEKAKELGLTNTNMVNSTGWPNKNHYMSPRDLAVLSQAIIKEFPEHYKMYSEKSFTYNGIKQENRNPLLFLMPQSADGIKTGHTSVSGYGLVGSAKKGERRIIMVLNGLKTMRERSEESRKMMNWAFKNFDNYKIVQKNINVVDVPVWMGAEKTVEAIPLDDTVLTLQKGTQKKVKAVVKYDIPLKAPIKKGQKIADLTIEVPNQDAKTIPLYASKDVGRLGYFGRLKELIKYFLFKSVPQG